FDGRIQCQQVGLGGDAMDQLDHLADLLGTGGQDLDGRVGTLGIADGPAAAATVSTLLEALCEAELTVEARALASLAVDVIDCAVVCMPLAAVDTERTIPLTLRSK